MLWIFSKTNLKSKAYVAAQAVIQKKHFFSHKNEYNLMKKQTWTELDGIIFLTFTLIWNKEPTPVNLNLLLKLISGCCTKSFSENEWMLIWCALCCVISVLYFIKKRVKVSYKTCFSISTITPIVIEAATECVVQNRCS